MNDVQRVYNSFEQLVTEYQEHSGAVNTSTSVNVQYQYANGSSNTIRPTALVYPNGRVLNYDYGIAGGIDDALSRIASLFDNDGVTHLADYTRIGASTFVEQSSPQPQIAWSLINGMGIDPYTGFDQFNRVIDNRWYSTADSADLDRIQHGYDRASNRLWRRNTVAEAAGVYLDELYAYDGLSRLSQMQRGQLDTANSAIVNDTTNFAQAWGLDATGNWQQFWQSDTGASWDLQQSRSASKTNEIASIVGGGWAQPAYDAAGNTVQMPQANAPATPNVVTFDAWNRLIDTFNGSSPAQQNAYDGANRRVTDLHASTLRHCFFSLDWRCVEERLGMSSAVDRQFLWGELYIDNPLLRDRGSERLYALQDPNWNVTAACDTGGVIRERYAYSSYGGPVFFSDAFLEIGGSGFEWETLFAGYRWDAGSALYNLRERYLQFSLGRFASVDPLARASMADRYVYADNMPIDSVDPSGLQGCKCTVKEFVREGGCGLYDTNGITYGYDSRIRLKFGPCCCCCEFRQYVLSNLSWTSVGINGLQLPLGRRFAEGEEDCEIINGVRNCYGYPASQVPRDSYSDFGCAYCRQDTSGYSNLLQWFGSNRRAWDSIIIVHIDLTFLYNVIDVCAGGVVRSEVEHVECHTLLDRKAAGIGRRFPGRAVGPFDLQRTCS